MKVMKIRPSYNLTLSNVLSNHHEYSDAGKMFVKYCQSFDRQTSEVLFDGRVKDLILDYAWDPNKCQATIDYLNQVVDTKGIKYSRSARNPQDLYDALEHFKGRDYSSFRWNENYQQALRVITDQLDRLVGTKKLSPLVYTNDEDVVSNIPKKTTHAGATWLVTGKKHKGENLENAYSRMCERSEFLRNHGTVPILCGSRTQGSGAIDDETGEFTNTCKHKTRLVCMVDLWTIVLEQRFVSPLQRVFNEWDWYAGGTSDAYKERIIQNWRGKYVYFTCLDYSKYDMHVSSWLIEDAFNILKHLFVLDEHDSELFDALCYAFIHKTFITPKGDVVSHRGIPSGSNFTQIIGSLVNMIMVTTACLSLGVSQYQMMVMGDDNLLFYDSPTGEEEAEFFNSYISHNFGITVNDSKANHGIARHTAPEFLSRYWRAEGIWREPNVLLSHILFPERWRDYIHADEFGHVLIPEDIVSAYIDCYDLGMSKLIDVDRFRKDCVRQNKHIRVNPSLVGGYHLLDKYH